MRDLRNKLCVAPDYASQWKGPATVVAVKSPYGYLVELDGARHHVHANELRKFHVRVDEVIFEPVFDEEVNGYTLEVGTCAS